MIHIIVVDKRSSSGNLFVRAEGRDTAIILCFVFMKYL